jgi:hypothetical protein
MILPLVATLLFTAPQEAPIDVGKDSKLHFAWDWDGTHEDGTPGAEVVEAWFRFTPEDGGSDRMVKVPHVGVPGENRVPAPEALAGVPAGVYDLQVRLIDPGGQSSGYSTPVLVIRVRVKNPSPPANVRVVGS